jgi:hypothetical protein
MSSGFAYLIYFCAILHSSPLTVNHFLFLSQADNAETFFLIVALIVFLVIVASIFTRKE